MPRTRMGGRRSGCRRTPASRRSRWRSRSAAPMAPRTCSACSTTRSIECSLRRAARNEQPRRRRAMNWHALDLQLLGLPFIAGLLVLATHVPLGTQVLDRGIVFIDLAVAQIAGLGVIVADALGFAERGVGMQVA